MKYIFVFIIVLFTGELYAQEGRSTFYSTSYLQIKENANYGLVFSGPALDIGMRWEIPSGSHSLLYEYKIGLGLPFSKKIIGLNMSFKPADLSYLWNIWVGKMAMHVGPALRLQYDVQFYPDLQSGYDYWMTNYSTGIRAIASVPFNWGTVSMSLFNSIMGFTSRTTPYGDPYYFDLGFGEVLKDIHSNLKFSGPGSFDNTSVGITCLFKKHSRLSVSYLVDYYGYYGHDKFQMLNHSVSIAVKAKKLTRHDDI